MSSHPSWTPEYGAENSSQSLLNICIAFAILETFFVIAFIFSWHFNSNNSNNTKAVYLLVLTAYIFSLGGVVVGILKITIGGAGYHAETLEPETIRRMLQLVKVHEVLYVLAIPFPKLAILCLYFKLFRSKASRYILYLTGIIIVLTCLFGLVASFANCRPFHSFWDRGTRAHCTMDVMLAFRFYSIPNIATDTIMLLMPIPALWKLNVGLMTRIGVALTFLTSTFGIVTAVLRFIAFLNVDVFTDITYLCISTTTWTVIEPGVYLVAATMPTLRPLIRRMFNEVNGPVSRRATRCFRSSTETVASDHIPEEGHRLHKKPSAKELFETIGRRPSRTLQLDSYHRTQRDPAVMSIRSDDEESMVCADAILHESMGRQGRNPDGTLRIWSLQPIQLSPLRTSFFFANNN